MEWLARVNWVDVIVIIIILRSTYVGSQRGLLGEFFHIFWIFIAIIFSTHLYFPISQFLNKYLFIAVNISDLISFLFVAGVIYLIFRFAGKFLQSFDADPLERKQEEMRVHEVTQKALGSLKLPHLDYVLEAYRNYQYMEQLRDYAETV